MNRCGAAKLLRQAGGELSRARAGPSVPGGSLSCAALSLLVFLKPGALHMRKPSAHIGPGLVSQSRWGWTDQVDSAGRVREGLFKAPRRAAAEGLEVEREGEGLQAGMGRVKPM